MLFLSYIDLHKNELRNAVIQNITTAPSGPAEGQIYFNSSDKTLYVYANSAWRDLLGVGNAYTSFSDGTTTASAVGDATFKLRSANSALTIAVQDNDATHGDNALFTINAGSIDHNSLLNYSANRHIDHTAVTITAGVGLSGGGNIADNRTINLDYSGTEMTVAGETGTDDRFAIYDNSAAAMRYITFQTLVTALNSAITFPTLNFENGLTNTSGTVKLGGALTGSTTISGNFQLLRTGSVNNAALFDANNAGTTSIGIAGTGTATGIQGTSSGGTGVIGSSGVTPISANNTATTTNTVVTGAKLTRAGSFTGADGNGIQLDFEARGSTNVAIAAGSIVGKLTTATTASSVGALEFYTRTANAPALAMTLAGSRQMTLHGYGAGTFTGTVTRLLAVTAAGAVVEQAATFVSNAYSSFSGDTGGAISATGAEELKIVGGTGVSTVSAAGTPDTLTINLDLPELTALGEAPATDDLLLVYDTSTTSHKKITYSNLVSNLVGGVTYMGTWNATTNTPTITSSVGTKGHYYVVATAGATNINGITDWKVGDWIIFNGTAWEKVDNTDQVTSVFSRSGVITAQAGDYNAGQITVTTTNFTQLGGTSTNAQLALDAADDKIQELFTALTSIPRKFTSGTISLGTTPGTQTITHNLNTQSVTVSIRSSSTNEIIYADVVANGVNTVQVTGYGDTVTAIVTVIG
jgi:hypothetical protein